MTTIAWDGKTLAADRKRTINRTPMKATKVWTARNGANEIELYGAAGSAWDALAVRRWTLGEALQPVVKNIAVIRIDAQRRIWFTEEDLAWVEITLPWWAIGSGSDYALGVMAVGLPAKRAIEIASKLDSATGFGVDVLRFPA